MATPLSRTFPRGAAQALATVTSPSKGVFLLSMHNLPDNRLTPVKSLVVSPRSRANQASLQDFIKTAVRSLVAHVVTGGDADPGIVCLQLLPALDDIELTFRKNFVKGDTEASLVLTGERVKNKFFSCGVLSLARFGCSWLST